MTDSKDTYMDYDGYDPLPEKERRDREEAEKYQIERDTAFYEEFADETYTQELTLGDGQGIVFAENDDEEVDFYLKYSNDDTILTYELELDSDVTDVASELDDESIIILGREYAIQSIVADADDEIKISLLGGENSGLIAGVGASEEFEGPGCQGHRRHSSSRAEAVYGESEGNPEKNEDFPGFSAPAEVRIIRYPAGQASGLQFSL